MREIRICVTEVPLKIGPVILKGQAARHVSKVLRRQPGDPLTLFDGAGRSGEAVIRRIQRDLIEVELLTLRREDTESPLRVLLAMAVVRADPMDLVIQKATELGVTTIQPVLTERSVVRLSRGRAEKRLAHWHRLAASACEQCGRNTLPGILQPLALTSWLGDLGAAGADEFRLLAHPSEPDGFALPTVPVAETIVLVGPEGGLSDEEIGLAKRVGFVGISLGPRVLRAETAAVALLSLVQWQLGDMGRD